MDGESNNEGWNKYGDCLNVGVEFFGDVNVDEIVIGGDLVGDGGWRCIEVGDFLVKDLLNEVDLKFFGCLNCCDGNENLLDFSKIVSIMLI